MDALICVVEPCMVEGIAVEQMAWPVVVECVRAFKLAGLVEKKFRAARALTRLISSSL